MVKDSGVRGFLDTEGNRESVERHLSFVFRCSSRAMMLRFPGFHAHAVCRTPIRSDVPRDESSIHRVAGMIARERIAAGFFKEGTSFYPLIENYVVHCPWGAPYPDKPPLDPTRPTGLTHPDGWTNEQRDHAIEYGQRRYIEEQRGGAAAAAVGGAGAGGAGAKRQRTLRNRRSRHQPRLRKTRRKSRQSIGPRSRRSRSQTTTDTA
jgi:hypothetical protein